MIAIFLQYHILDQALNVVFEQAKKNFFYPYIKSKLKAGFTIEAMHDITSFHRIDIQGMMVELLKSEINSELDAEILRNMRELASR